MLRFLILILLASQPLFAQLPDTLRNAVFTRYYGNKPANLEFLNLKENIDSLAIQIWADRSKNAASHDFSFNFLDPDFPEFTASLAYRFHADYGNLAEFQNFFRWVRRFDTRRFVLINIASQQLTFYEDNI